MADDLKTDAEPKANEEQNQYSLTVSILQNKLELHLLDKKTKYLYHGSFGSDALHKECGFDLKQTQNLRTVSKFIETARSGHHGLQFAITIEANENTQVEHADFGVITITKPDAFWPQQLIMKLKQTPRNEIDIIKEHVNDLQAENEKLQQALKSANVRLDEVSKHVMPAGSIVMWSGSVQNIPNGWKLCNGEDGTPDLQNRFVVGASQEIAVNATGGSKVHTHDITVNPHRLTVDEMPSHNHAPAYSGTNYALYSWHERTGYWVGNSNGGSYYVRSDGSSCKSTGGGQAHSHLATASEKNHFPPYYALCFIIKTV